jgi:hypothetical protein
MTKLYFHATANNATGLPTSEQSSLTVDNNGDSASTNRTMNDTIGTSQNSLACITTSTTSAQVEHFSRFVTRTFSNTSISANTWNYAFAVEQDNVNANFPCSSSGKAIWVSVYVWNPATQTKVGNIIDGVSNADFDEPSSSATEISVFGTFSGAAVNSIPSGCVIVYECMFQITMNSAAVRNLIFYYDGPTENNANGNTVSNHASYIETPQTITFQNNAVKAITSTVTIGAVAPTRKKGSVKPITTTVTSSTSSLVILRAKKRTITTTVIISSTPAQILAHNIIKAVPAETVTIGAVAPTRTKTWVRKLVETITISSTPTHKEVPYRPFRNIIETVTINSILTRLSAKKRQLLN